MLMELFFDFEMALSQVKSKRTQKYLNEVLSTYYNHEYRSCIVMLYATTFADALEKIKTMAEVYKNEKAEDFLKTYEANRESNKAYSALERDVKEFVVKSGLINDVEKKQWDHLKDYRDYCAHPVVEKDYELISPNAEQVRMHIRNMFEALFLKDAILTDVKIFDEFLSKVESFYDRNEFDGLKEYVSTRYIQRLDFKTKGKFIKNLWKFSFYISNVECDKYRAVACRLIIWIIESDKNAMLEFISDNIDYFNGKIDYTELVINKGDRDFEFYENKSIALMFFLYKVPEVYKMLSEDNQTEIQKIAYKNVNILLISPYLFEGSNIHIDAIKANLIGLNYCFIPYLANEICKRAREKFDTNYNELMIYYFFNCQNSLRWSPDWDYINQTYMDIISNILPYFTQKQCNNFISGLNEFYTQATCFRSFARQMVDYIKEKGFDIQFEQYAVNLLDYIDGN